MNGTSSGKKSGSTSGRPSPGAPKSQHGDRTSGDEPRVKICFVARSTAESKTENTIDLFEPWEYSI